MPRLWSSIAVVLLSLAVPASASAPRADDTTLEVRAGVRPAVAGEPVTLRLRLEGGTKSGSGRPATSTRIRVGLPRELRWNGRRWPRRARCSAREANRRQTASVCPSASRVGRGRLVLVMASGDLRDEARISAHVTTSGDLGLFVDTSTRLPLDRMLVGRVDKRGFDIRIPATVQEPAPGVEAGIAALSLSLSGERRGRGVLETVGCRGRWLFQVVNRLRGGVVTDSASQRCTP